jgi:flagellar assembly protein FliH
MKTPFAPSISLEPRRPRFLGAAANDARERKLFAEETQAAGLAVEAPPPPPPPPAPAVPAAEVEAARREATARLAAAIDRLQLAGARLAEEARSDVLELAFQIARRILESELRAGSEALFALVRSAVRRVGEARRVSVRLHPHDAGAVQVALDSSDPAVVTLARVELVADPSLSPGDCVVDSDAGQVDGRLASRLQELRRAVDAAAEESAA